MRVRFSSWMAAVALLCAGCGNTTMPWSSGSQDRAGGDPGGGQASSIAVSPASLSFSALAGGSRPPDQSAHVTIHGTVWVGIQFTGAAIADATLVQTSGSTGDVVVTPVDPTVPGTFTGTVTVFGCVDSQCSAQVPGSPKVVTVTYLVSPESLRVSPAAIALDFVEGISPAYVETTLSVSDTASATASVTVSDGAAWLTVTPASTLTLPGALRVRATPGTLGTGAYAATISFTSASGTRQVPVTLSVVRAALQASRATLSFSGVNGTAIPAQSLNLTVSTGLGLAWTATAADAWVVLDSTGGTTPTALGVSVDPAQGPLASGTHTSSVTLSASFDGAVLTTVVPITLVLVKPDLMVAPLAMTAGGVNGRDLTPAALRVFLSSATGAYPFTVSADRPWIGFDASSGDASTTPTTLHATWDRTGLVGGTYTGTIRVSAAVNGDTLTATIPVTLGLDAHLLLADDDGVAFARTPSLDATTRTLHVRDNFGQATPWTATSNRAWLSVTPSGTTPADLVLTVDPAGLATDAVHEATVTLASPDFTVENVETIHVGLWVGAADPASRTDVAAAYSDLVVDPVRPYAYVHGSSGSSLTVYNIYTGAVVTTLSSVGSALGPMAASSDGEALFIVDTVNHQIVPVHLSNLSVGTPFAAGTSTAVFLATTRTNGKRLLVAGNGHVFDPARGVDLGSSFSGGYYGNLVLAVSQDGTRLAATDTGLSPSGFLVYSTDYTAANGGKVLFNVASWGSGGSNGQDVALSADGARLYTACGAPYEFGVFDVTGGAAARALTSLPGVPYPRNVEVARDGRIIGGADGYYNAVDTWIYDPSGTLLASTKLSGYARTTLPRQLKISGDGLRLAALTDDPYLRFFTIAP